MTIDTIDTNDIEQRSCSCCTARFAAWCTSKDGNYFESDGCAANLTYHDKIDMHTITTSYGSDFDGAVFVVNDPSKFEHALDICDICIGKGVVSGDFDYLYNYMSGGLEYNPKFKGRIIAAFGDTVRPIEDQYLKNIIDHAHKLAKG